MSGSGKGFGKSGGSAGGGYVLAVGQLYHPNRRKWPEGPQYNFRKGGHELLLLLESPTEEEIRGVARGRAQLCLVVLQPVILLLYQFGAADAGLPWSDAPYSWHLLPEGERALPEPPEQIPQGGGALLQVVLVDASTGLVKALRVLTLEHEFTQALHGAILTQTHSEWIGGTAFGGEIEAIYNRYPTVEALLAVADHRMVSVPS